MHIVSIVLALLLEIIPAGDAFLNQLQKRDSILVGDQLEYGFRLDSVKAGTEILLPDFSQASNDTLTLVRAWQLDTAAHSRKATVFDIAASIVIAPFEEGKYQLPQLSAVIGRGKDSDTLLFSAMEMEVKTIPLDTASFRIHDIKAQKRYPVTIREIIPYILGFQVVAALIVAAACLVLMKKRRNSADCNHGEPAYLVALRALDRFRSDKNWAPERQKAFYSGVTDALKNYIADRFGVDAPEMTTKELFDALKGRDDLSPELYNETRDMFETADFVKFARMTVPDQENAKVLPLAVRFVTSTYQTELEEEQKENVL